MRLHDRQIRSPVNCLSVAFVLLTLLPSLAAAEQGSATLFPLRNHNPFLQVFGLPPFQSAVTVANGEFKYSATMDVVNHADAGRAAGESITIDGESYFLNLSARYGVNRRLELGIDVPFVGHAQGFLDQAIYNWHNLLGISNSKRRGPENRMNFSYVDTLGTTLELHSPGYGVGDLQLTAAVPLSVASDSDRPAVALRASVKLPTGSESKLHGSGAVDASFGIYGFDSRTLADREIELSGFAGVLVLGTSDIFARQQRSAVPFAGIAAAFRVSERFDVTAQIYGQGSYIDSALDELGGRSMQLALGGTYHPRKHRPSLSFAIVEDISADATPDFAVHVAMHWSGGHSRVYRE